MKFNFYAILFGIVAAKKLRYYDGANDDHLYKDTKANHWRYEWPQGHVDNGDGDADVINKFSLPEKKKKEEDKTEMYAWKYDPDVIQTGHSIT